MIPAASEILPSDFRKLLKKQAGTNSNPVGLINKFEGFFQRGSLTNASLTAVLYMSPMQMMPPREKTGRWRRCLGPLYGV
jgi:hypothetical protein